MEKTKDFEKLLTNALSYHSSGIESPDPSLIFDARRVVMARKKQVKEPMDLFAMLLAFFKMELKVYHVGLCLLLFSAGFFYVKEPSYTDTGTVGLTGYRDALSTQNTTISVNSSTLLTSIPTLVIRN
jgi:hypothetical protein